MKVLLLLAILLGIESCSTEDVGAGATSHNSRGASLENATQSQNDADSADSTADDDSGTGNSDVSKEAKNFFLNTVATKFEVECKGCHALPQNPTEVKAPLTIFSYTKMRALLAKGPSGDNNDLLNKMRGMDSHSGGDRCGASGPDASPCLEVVQWWEKEFGQGQGGNIPGSPLKGKLESIGATGDVAGFALDSTQTAATSTVMIYIDRTAGGGSADFTLTANQSGAAGGYPGNHRFAGTLPDAFRDGKDHTANAYVVVNGTATLLQSGTLAYRAWAPTAAGQSYYNATVRPVLQTRCASCHVIQYASQYAALIGPAPNQGGTVTNNDMINFPAGMNNHPGGNLCGTKSGSPCNLIQQWWNLEFGN